MEFILIFLLLVVTLGAVLTWTRRGQSSIGRESGDTIAKARHKAQVLPLQRRDADHDGPRSPVLQRPTRGHDWAQGLESDSPNDSTPGT
jgi:hypothetical protein